MDRRRFIGAAAAAAVTLPAARSWAADATSARAAPKELQAATLSGKSLTLKDAEIKEFRSSLSGRLLLASDEGYDQARRIWNGAFDRHPALIARCKSTADVVKAVQFAHAHSLLTAVKGGGHSLSGQSTCDGGLMIDLSPMKEIQIDAGKRSAAAQPGVLLAELDRETATHDLVTTLGTASDTGIAGLTLGGGQGRLMRALGLTCDNVRAYEIVTADGKLMKVSAQENPDLFWALRGGGGNFGVVTRFDYQLHPIERQVLAGGRLYPFSETRAVFSTLIDMAMRAPDELYLSGGITSVPPGGPIPAGRYVGVEMVYYGDPKEGERHLAPLDKLGKALSDNVTAQSYIEAQNGQTGAAPPALPPGLGVYVKSGFLNSVSDKLITEIIHATEHAPEWLDSIGLGTLGGAIARVKLEATAYWNRQAQWDLILAGVWFDHARDTPNAALLRDMWKAFEPFTHGYYVNTEPSAEDKRLRATYGDNYPRLEKLKKQYDPTNLFRLNANIRPAQV
jgi:hypothetical protein